MYVEPPTPHEQERDGGATATEYALLVTLITIAIFATVLLFGQNVARLFENSASSLPFT